jgi:hypothetical protein
MNASISRSNPWFSSAVVFFVFCASVVAQIPYLTNRAEAFQLASNEARTIILYTGGATSCWSNDPRAYFFKHIIPNYPQLGLRSNAYVVCEQFVSDPYLKNPLAVQEFRRFTASSDRYDIRSLAPTLTMLDASGIKLNGPFARAAALPSYVGFAAKTDSCYLSLSDYVQSNPPLTLAQAQSNAARFFFATNQPHQPIGLLHCEFDPVGGQPKIFLQSGVESTCFELKEPFRFRCRIGGVQRTNHPGRGFEETVVTLAGTNVNARPYEADFLVRMSDVYFPAMLRRVSDQPDWGLQGVGGVTVLPNEQVMRIFVRDDEIAKALLKGLTAALSREEAE